MVNPNKFYTYAYLREDKTPYYIGKGKESRAYKRSKKDIKPPKDKTKIIYLKQNLTEEEAFKHEIYMIAVFGRIDLGTGILYNRTNGGDGCSGLIHSPETRAKLSAANKGENNPHYGKNRSPETRAKLSVAKKGENNPNYGKSPSPETRAKMSDAKKNMTSETRAKLSAARKGKNNPNYGKTHSPETRAKIGAARKGKNNPMYGKKWWTDGENNKLAIECPDDGWVLGRNL